MSTSYIKLYGPSIYMGQDALEKMMKGLISIPKVGSIIQHMVSMIDPSFDLATGELLGHGDFILGEYDFAINWKSTPTKDQVRTLIQRIDDALRYTGCKYSITTKKTGLQ